MVDVMSAYGLNMDNLDAFGFDATRAQMAFSEAAVVDFVEGLFDNAMPALTWDGEDYFNFAVQADAVLETFPLQAQQSFSYVDYMNTVNQQMIANTGHGLNDLHVSISNGFITGTVDGVGSGTVNILDAVNSSLSSLATNPAFISALDNLEDTLNNAGLGDLGDLISGLFTPNTGGGSTGGNFGDLINGILTGDTSNLDDLFPGLFDEGDDISGSFDPSILGGDLGGFDLSGLGFIAA